MTRENLYDIVSQFFEKYGYELVDGVCNIKEEEDKFVISVNSESLDSGEFIDMMDDLENFLFYEEECQIIKSSYFNNQYLIKIKK